jgi:transcriptional regulator PpsR
LLTRKHSIEGKVPFGDADGVFGAFDAAATGMLAMVAGDVTLVIDGSGVILDATANPDDFPGFAEWIGRDWLDTVTVESRPKIMEMLAGARKGTVQHWRQVTHVTGSGDIPVRYVVIPSKDGERHIAFGRDLREAARLQQRLLQAQQSLERDYLRTRRIETRYRLLFDQSAEAVLILEGDGFRIKEANQAAHRLLGEKPGSLIGTKLLHQFARETRDGLIAFLGSVLSAASVSPTTTNLAKGGGAVTLSATGFRQHGKQCVMVRVATEASPEGPEAGATLAAIENMPDAFVLTDARKAIVAANLAFVELAQAASLDQIRGRPLSDFLGRPGIDLELIEGQLTKHGFARNVSTVVGAGDNLDGEPVEISAVMSGGDEPHYGFVIREVGRRLQPLPASGDEQPRSVEQLTELVGRMSLKDIVRESTDLIERLCIEAALSYTSDNRASAAEILGLSRQSLYSKLHRYGLGNLVAESE